MSVVNRGFPCPRCATDDAFVTRVFLGDRAEMETDACATCDLRLTADEEAEMLTTAWEAAPEEYQDMAEDFRYEQGRNQ